MALAPATRRVLGQICNSSWIERCRRKTWRHRLLPSGLAGEILDGKIDHVILRLVYFPLTLLEFALPLIDLVQSLALPQNFRFVTHRHALESSNLLPRRFALHARPSDRVV